MLRFIRYCPVKDKMIIRSEGRLDSTGVRFTMSVMVGKKHDTLATALGIYTISNPIYGPWSSMHPFGPPPSLP